MDVHYTLVRIYLFICRHYQGRLAAIAQRQSNNNDPDFTDKEVLTIYLFGLFKKRTTVNGIYEYVDDHFSDWFPDLPSYQSYNRRLNRLNRLNAVFPPLVERALEHIDSEETRAIMLRIADSMPIMMAKGQRASQATVASEQIADVGYCSSKDTFYHGVKLHVIAEKRSDTLPLLDRVGLTPGSKNDLQAARLVLPAIEGGVLCGDKAYCDGPLKERLAEDQNLALLTPIKKEKGQKTLSAADTLYSEAVSRLRQPIESLFSWIDEKTEIQCASKVRSYRGLLVHVFGRLTAAMLILALNP
ncbi:transposase [Longimonas halophila]|uniref:Transposase n=1 Tax=Longimonas halophila TaxID=1469170 RepID=A0A2H3NSU6_9BACT|nr:transposase [Longimonas halophila]PEN06781.1 transposase [Longimonas halophila]